MLLRTLIVFVLTVSCGYQADDKTKKTTDPVDPSAAALSAELEPTSVDFTGYISPINISVDGKNYTDGDDFYTKELTRLQAVVDKEYPKYTFSFEADVGLQDLKQGMSVFLVSQNNGYSSETTVDGQGQFNFYIPKTAEKDSYLIRAYKKIGLRLTPDDQTAKEIYWCYNLYAEHTQTLEKASVVLNSFTTNITKYQCSSAAADGIQIPVAVHASADPSLSSGELSDLKNLANGQATVAAETDAANKKIQDAKDAQDLATAAAAAAAANQK